MDYQTLQSTQNFDNIVIIKANMSFYSATDDSILQTRYMFNLLCGSLCSRASSSLRKQNTNIIEQPVTGPPEW